jgi:hypothetical protein
MEFDAVAEVVKLPEAGLPVITQPFVKPVGVQEAGVAPQFEHRSAAS